MIERVLQAQRDFYKDRPTMDRANNVDFLKRAVAQEAQELNDSPPEYMDEQTYLEQELADVFLFAFALCDQLSGEEDVGAFIGRIVLEKISRNMVKYPAKHFTSGKTYQEAVSLSKLDWSITRGNEEFYE